MVLSERTYEFVEYYSPEGVSGLSEITTNISVKVDDERIKDFLKKLSLNHVAQYYKSRLIAEITDYLLDNYDSVSVNIDAEDNDLLAFILLVDEDTEINFEINYIQSINGQEVSEQKSIKTDIKNFNESEISKLFVRRAIELKDELLKDIDRAIEILERRAEKLKRLREKAEKYANELKEVNKEVKEIAKVKDKTFDFVYTARRSAELIEKMENEVDELNSEITAISENRKSLIKSVFSFAKTVVNSVKRVSNILKTPIRIVKAFYYQDNLREKERLKELYRRKKMIEEKLNRIKRELKETENLRTERLKEINRILDELISEAEKINGMIKEAKRKAKRKWTLADALEEERRKREERSEDDDYDFGPGL